GIRDFHVTGVQTCALPISGQRPAELPEGLGTDEATADIVAWLAAEGWSTPETLPRGMRVVDVELYDADGGEVLEVEIAGAMAHEIGRETRWERLTIVRGCG